MKREVLPLLSVTVALLLMAACQEAGPQVAAPGLGAAGEEPALPLVPYADLESGSTGIVPAGWVEFSPGHFQPTVPHTAPTLTRTPGGPRQVVSACSTEAHRTTPGARAGWPAPLATPPGPATQLMTWAFVAPYPPSEGLPWEYRSPGMRRAGWQVRRRREG